MDGDCVDMHATWRKEGDQSEVRITQPPPRPAESRFRCRTKEYWNAREARLFEFVGEHATRDSADSGDRRFEYSLTGEKKDGGKAYF